MVRVVISGDTRYPADRKVLKKAVHDIFAKYKVEDIDAEVSIAIIGKRKMKMLSDKYFDDGQIHAVISFPLEEVTGEKGGAFINPPDGILRLGDVILCWPKVLEAASRDDVFVDEEVYSLVSHGVEHLLGKHHE